MVLVIVIYNLIVEIVVIVIIIHLKYIMLGNCFGQKGVELPILFLRIS